jgi:hypothetical protein
LLSFESEFRPGWMIDDISITVSNDGSGILIITNNLMQGSYSFTGPVNGSGAGLSYTLSNAPSGQYTVSFNPVPYYQTPASQMNTLPASGTLTLGGNYTFADANTNGIPDLYELEKFSNVDPLRTHFTDTDADGLSDYGEFVAGTDPSSPPRPFQVRANRLTNGPIQLSWPTDTSHQYRIHGSVSLASWSPFTGWLTPTGTNTTFTLPSPTNGAPKFFRIEATPVSGIPGLFRLTAQRTNGLLRIDWPSASGHGYRVFGATNLNSWAPLTDWIRATNNSTAITLPSPGGNTRSFFRIEARP